MMNHPTSSIAVFVYGTLMQGQRAHHMMAGAEYVGKATLQDYAMYHLGRYPGILPCPGECSIGEVYYVNQSKLEKMDIYEEEGDLYRRVTVQLQTKNGIMQAQAYVYNRDVAGCPILRQGWIAGI